MNKLMGLGYRAELSYTLDQLSPAMLDRLSGIGYVFGVDPAYIGLHYGDSDEEANTYSDGSPLAYSRTAHCAYAHNQLHLPADRRQTTVVIPTFADYDAAGWFRPSIVAHEIGHVLHEIVGFDWMAVPASPYSHENYLEAFAESFEAWWGWNDYYYELLEKDPKTMALFERLSE